MPYISEEDLSRIVAEANRQGLMGRMVEIHYFPPSSATKINGIIAVEDKTPTTAAQNWSWRW